MRPRISIAEAQFLLETMQIRKEEIQGLIERKAQLERELFHLRKEALYHDTYKAIKDGYLDKKEELQQLEALRYKLYTMISCYDSLVAKFQTLASGEKRKGRYKSRATFHHWLLNSLEKKEPKHS